MPKPAVVKSPFTKAQLLNAIVEDTDLSRKQVIAVIDSLSGVIKLHIEKNGPGTFTFPGLLKITTQRKPSREARKGAPNPFRPGETMDIAAKPASTTIKVRPLKGLKDMVD